MATKTRTAAPALVASSITRRLRRADVEVSSARNLDRTYPTVDGEFVELVGRVTVALVTFDMVDGRIVERDAAASAAAAAAVLEAAGFVVIAAGRGHLEVTLPDRAELLEAKAERAQGHTFAPSQLRHNAGADMCVLCRETEAHWIHDAGRRIELAAAARLAAGPAADVVDLTVDEAPAEQLELEAPAATVVVIPCSGAKLDRPAPAGELYTGSLHRMAAAAGAATGHRVVVLSALHGLLELDRVVAPYDVTMTDAESIAAAALADQLVELGRPRIVALTPGAYTRRLAAAAALAGCDLEAPLAGSRGIGEIRGRLARIRDRRASVAA